MKQIMNIIIGIIMIFMLANTAIAVDINALDRVSVLMTKPNVLSLLGAPDKVIDVGSGLKADIYKLNNMEPMVGAVAVSMKMTRVLQARPLFFREKWIRKRLNI